jgi:hypothetical protein
MTDSSSNKKESNPVLEDTSKISGDMGSTDIGPDNGYMNAKLSRKLQEHYVRKHKINIWHVPSHHSFNSLFARVNSFEGAD